MSKDSRTVRIPDDYRDLIQRLHLEWYQKDRVIRGLMEDHQFDDDPAAFLNTDIFKAYEEKVANALLAYETAKDDLEQRYVPDDYKDKSYQWSLDYATCVLTFTLA